MSFQLINLLETPQINITSYLESELVKSNFINYTQENVSNLLLIYSGYNGYYASSLCHELIYKYLYWLEQNEQNSNNIKNKLINYFNVLLQKINLKVVNTQQPVITSQELKTKINNAREELKIYDNKSLNIIDIKKRITGMILNKKLETSQYFDPFDDELETIIMD